MQAYRAGTTLLSLVVVALGLALLVRGAIEGAPFGLLLGVLFLAAGIGRLHLLRRR
jgi:uncharacterized protein (DUF58 family)